MVKVLGYAGIPFLIMHSNTRALVHPIIHALEKGHRLLGPGNIIKMCKLHEGHVMYVLYLIITTLQIIYI
jgi:hypothetical protein